MAHPHRFNFFLSEFGLFQGDRFLAADPKGGVRFKSPFVYLSHLPKVRLCLYCDTLLTFIS